MFFITTTNPLSVILNLKTSK